MDGEIISADSRQIYKGMDIGTGKDLDEYTIGDVKIPYHLIYIKEAGYLYNIAEYQLDFHKALKQVKENKRQPILCGGSGLYIETALEGNKYLGIRPNQVEQAELESLSDEEIEAAFEEVSERIKNDLNARTRARKIRAVQISNYIDLINSTLKSLNKSEDEFNVISILPTFFSDNNNQAKMTLDGYICANEFYAISLTNAGFQEEVEKIKRAY